MANEKSSASTPWKVEGDYFEGCNCPSICPCLFLADPTEGDCKLTIAWRIDKGNYGSVQLNGLNAVGRGGGFSKRGWGSFAPPSPSIFHPSPNEQAEAL